MTYEPVFGLPDDVPELASALDIEDTKEKHVIKNFKGTSSIIHQFDPTTKFSMTVEAIDSDTQPGDGSEIGIPGLPAEGYIALDSVKKSYKQDGNGTTAYDGVVYPEGAPLEA